MRKKFALFNMYINISIYKLLGVLLLSGAVQTLLFCLANNKYSKRGFVRVIYESKIELAIIITIVPLLLSVISPFVRRSHVENRLKTLSSSKVSKIFSNFFAKLYLITVAFIFETVLLFVFAKFFTLSPNYKNGPQGIVSDFFREDTLYFFFPYHNTDRILMNIGLIVGTALICTITSLFIYGNISLKKDKTKKEAKKGENTND